MKTAWKWFSGKKTVLAALIFSIAKVCDFTLDESTTQGIIEVVEWVALVITGVGVTHKSTKGDLT